MQAFLNAPQHTAHGYAIGQSTGLKSGTVYPILMRLADQGFVDASWEAPQQGKPPRHVYRLTAQGLKIAVEVCTPRAARTSHRGI